MLKNWFKSLLLLAILCLNSTIFAQGIFIQNNSKASDLIERISVLEGKELQTSIKPFYSNDLEEIKYESANKIDRFSNKYLEGKYGMWLSQQKDSDHPKLYSDRNFFFHVNHKKSLIAVNPVLDFEVGNNNYFRNTRGFEVSGKITNKIGFYSMYIENQFTVPAYIEEAILDYNTAFPGIGRSRIFNGEYVPYKVRGYDGDNSIGYITFSPVQDAVMISVGKSSHFIGEGYRSLILSDFSNSYLNMNLRAKIWKFNYQVILGEFINYPNRIIGTSQYRKKHGAFHYLSTNIGNHVNIGIFEGVIMNRGDSLTQGKFDFNYANPVVFYRSTEYQIGSPDNVLFGLNGSVKLFSTMKIYSQLLFDEFHVDFLLKEKSGWWANKYAFQTGIKYFNAFGINHLDLNLEHNQVRPYTYSHWTSMEAYSNSAQPLAHPLGANFSENIFNVYYQPTERLSLQYRGVYYNKGIDSTEVSYGGDILKSYYNRPNGDFGHSIGQGLSKVVAFSSIIVRYELFNNLVLDLAGTHRTSKIGVINESMNWIRFSVRYNIDYRHFDY